jgi:Cupin
MSHIMEAVAAPTTIVCGSMSFDRASLKPITQLLPDFIMVKADQAYTVALHNTMQALASEMAEQSPGSEVVATRLAEVLFIQILRAHITSGSERNKGWLRAIFDPQIGTALRAIHDIVCIHLGRWNRLPQRQECHAPHSQHGLKSYLDKHSWSA